MAQQVTPTSRSVNTDSVNSTVYPNTPARDQLPDPDTLKGKTGKPSPLTATRLKQIVGNDKPVGKDSNGRQIYKGADNKPYYVNRNGNKVYIK
jgi:hypothetical protein